MTKLFALSSLLTLAPINFIVYANILIKQILLMTFTSVSLFVNIPIFSHTKTPHDTTWQTQIYDFLGVTAKAWFRENRGLLVVCRGLLA